MVHRWNYADRSKRKRDDKSAEIQLRYSKQGRKERKLTLRRSMTPTSATDAPINPSSAWLVQAATRRPPFDPPFRMILPDMKQEGKVISGPQKRLSSDGEIKDLPFEVNCSVSEEETEEHGRQLQTLEALEGRENVRTLLSTRY